MARLKGLFTSLHLSGGIRMDMQSIEMKHVDMHAVNGNRGLLTIAMMRGGEKLVKRVQKEIDDQGLNDSGKLRESIRVTDMHNVLNSGVTLSVGSDEYYATWVEEGTPAVIMARSTRGLYIGGSRLRMGRPTDKWGEGGAGMSVRGQKAHEYFKKALEASEISDYTRR